MTSRNEDKDAPESAAEIFKGDAHGGGRHFERDPRLATSQKLQGSLVDALLRRPGPLPQEPHL
eukprot:832344-Pyramimonas_sp.AAC.1